MASAPAWPLRGGGECWQIAVDGVADALLLRPHDNPSPRGFRRAVRLTGAARFRAVQRQGVRRRANTFELCWLAQPTLSRLGVVVNRQVGGAVVRSRLKRICREWYCRARPVLAHGDWVIRVLPPAAQRTTAVLWNDLTRLAQSATRRP